MNIIYFIIILMVSCSDFQEQDQILDYAEYIYQGWNAFETVNLDNFSQDSTTNYYYELAIDMFEVSVLAINYEFSAQNLIGPYYQSYNGLGWAQLYYANQFLEPTMTYKRDSLRQESRMFFNKALFNLNSQSSNLNILSQDRCDIYSGLSYVHYYDGLNSSIFDSSLISSALLLNECPEYNFSHDEIDFRNIHYLRGKIYLFNNDYQQACIEINQANQCQCDIDNLDISILLDCFNQFSNEE